MSTYFNEPLSHSAKISITMKPSDFSPSPMTALNRVIFSKIIQAQLTGRAALPHGLGLENTVYLDLLKDINHDPLFELEEQWRGPSFKSLRDRSQIIENLNNMRLAERNSLVDLLFNISNVSVPYAIQSAIIVATACLSPSHLWKTLGLLSREELASWLSHNFPDLVAQNDKNMRWKRFFYLQLCKSEGDYVCRSPSCESCTSYRECYVQP